MDFRTMEKPRMPEDEVCVHEMSTAEIVMEIKKELAETLSCLSGIKYSIDGKPIPERNMDEAKCFIDEIRLIEHMALDCLGLAHVIHDELFRNMERL